MLFAGGTALGQSKDPFARPLPKPLPGTQLVDPVDQISKLVRELDNRSRDLNLLATLVANRVTQARQLGASVDAAMGTAKTPESEADAKQRQDACVKLDALIGKEAKEAVDADSALREAQDALKEIASKSPPYAQNLLEYLLGALVRSSNHISTFNAGAIDCNWWTKRSRIPCRSPSLYIGTT
jgi:alkylhydroperoxidase/carboxymuconolactone decarboxylase family protein YurZ